MEKLFSVIIVHFNQPQYWEAAILSVLNQNYTNIQLIFSDDGSENFVKADIENFILQNRHYNLASYKILHNSQNLGTVQNINRALLMADGDYISIIAADDALYNEDVLNCYVKRFKTCSDICGGIFALSVDCTEELKDTGQYYINPKDAVIFNALSPLEQFKRLSYYCCIHLGAMAFTREMMKKYAPFDEKYKLIEDWPFLLRLTRTGGHLEYADFKSLKYRAGGISRPLSERDETITQNICKDHLKLYDNEILLYTPLFSFTHLKKILKKYDMDRSWMKKKAGDFISIKRIVILKHDPRVVFLLWDKLDVSLRRIIVCSFMSILYLILSQFVTTVQPMTISQKILMLIYLFLINVCAVIPTLHQVFKYLQKYLFNPYE